MAFDWKRGGSGAMSGAAAGSSFGPWGAAAGGALGAVGGFGGNPRDAANKYYDQIPGQMKPYYDPYINAGRSALGKTQGAYGEMMDDPNAIISRLGAGYKESPGYKWQLGQGEAAIGSANAAGGMAGTQQHMQQSGELANNLASQDYEKYLNHALGLYGSGVEGQQHISDQGYNASSSLADSLGNLLQHQGNMEYAGQNNEDQQLWGGMGNFASAFDGGGDVFNGSKAGANGVINKWRWGR